MPNDFFLLTLCRSDSLRELCRSVFAHPSTWGKLIRERGWRRPRLRLYPPKPKVGLRANAPNEAWHIDVSILRMLDGTKAYIHAIIDNYSRRILAWTIADHLDPMNTCFVLGQGASNLQASTQAAELLTQTFVEWQGAGTPEGVRTSEDSFTVVA